VKRRSSVIVRKRPKLLSTSPRRATYDVRRLRIGIIGAGQMGAALAAVWAHRHHVAVFDVDRAKGRRLAHRCSAQVASDLLSLAASSGVMLLAVKPQDLDELLRQLSSLCGARHLVISIAAGVTTRRIEQQLGRGSRIVRVMPNLAARVGAGMASLSRGRWATVGDLRTVGQLFDAVGRSAVVPERLVDAVTAISGSGPAYYFLLTAHLEAAARRLGLPSSLARRLAVQTLIGSGAVVCGESDVNPALLVKAVASRGGTTEAALAVFDRRQLGLIVTEAVQAAQRRARQLSR